MLTVLGIVVSTACILASVRRVQLASSASALDPTRLTGALRARSTDTGELWFALREAILAEVEADWEHDLLEALAAPESARVALVNEQLAELDHRAQAWGRAPRVCASISTSFGFMLAFALVASMATATEFDIGATITSAINVVAVGTRGSSASPPSSAPSRSRATAWLPPTRS